MDHPFKALRGEYAQLLSIMTVRPECRRLVDSVAAKLLAFKSRYEGVSQANGVPIVFIAASFEREASSNFNLSPAQGDPWRRVSVHVPAHRGPFPDWVAAALDAYRLNGLDKVGSAGWSWELMCFYGEMFNGFGYRDVHHMHSPYLWGGTNIQAKGKYTHDGHFDPTVMDTQLGMVPVMKRMVELDPTLDVGRVDVPIPPPQPSGLSVASIASGALQWIQATLNTLGHHPPLDVDGNYGRQTMHAVTAFQRAYGITTDGIAGPETTAALQKALSA